MVYLKGIKIKFYLKILTILKKEFTDPFIENVNKFSQGKLLQPPKP